MARVRGLGAPGRSVLVGKHYILVGDVLDGLSAMPAGSARCCVTSPPYWGLRDYGVEGQIGLEATPELFLERMVAVFRGVWRVLADDGTCWVNMGDCYATGAGSAGSPGGDCFGKANEVVDAGSFPASQPNRMPIAGLKPKDLVGMPWRLALALQADGWWLRSDIVWHKPNPMPESVTDRPTKSHEYIFLLTKAERYFYDAEAIKEPSVDPESHRGRNPRNDDRFVGQAFSETRGGFSKIKAGTTYPTRSARTVWTIATQAYGEAHFATFPEEIPTRCIKAGTSERGKCPACGAAWRRVVERVDTGVRQKMADGWDVGEGGHSTIHRGGRSKGEAGVPVLTSRTTGWEPGCACGGIDGALSPVPDVVLDPFVGSGTTLLVANKLGRDAVGCELNPEYAAMAERRIGQGLRPGTFRDENESKLEAGGLFQ